MDLQPKNFKVTIKEKEYDCKPLRMSHRLIIAKIQPLFDQFAVISKGEKIELTAEEMIMLEKELDVLISDLMPALRNVTLNIEDIADVINQLLDSVMPEDAKKLRDAKVNIETKEQEDTSLKGVTS